MASIIRKRGTILLVALIALAIGSVAIYAVFANGTPLPGGSTRDLRHEQIGQWNCGGVTTSPHGTERPFYGTLRNEWTLDRRWLKIDFEEQQPVTDPPLREEQYWSYSEANDQHTRIMLVNDNSYGVLTAGAWQQQALSWQGTYTVEGVAYVAKETSERQAENRYRWSGSVEQDGKTIARYEFVCTRK